MDVLLTEDGAASIHMAVALIAAVSISGWFLLRELLRTRTGSNYQEPPMVEGALPLLGHAVAFGKDPGRFLLDCHAKYGGIFKIRLLNKTYVMMDGKHRRTFFALPEKALSFDRAILETGVASDSTVGKVTVLNPWHVPIMKRALLEKNMGLYTHRIERQVYKALDQFGIGSSSLGVGDKAIVADLKPLAWTIVANSSATSFLGEDLVAQNPNVVTIFMEFHEACLGVIQAFNFVPDNLLWLMATKVKQHRSVLREVIVPEVERRRAAIAAAAAASKEEKVHNKSQQHQHDVMVWLIETGRPAQEIADRFMAFIFASMITTAGAMTHALNDLAGRQDQWEGLLAEQDEVMKKHGTQVVTQEALKDMNKLHAFIRESIRMGALPIQQTRIAVKEGIELEPGSGVFLPKGAVVAISGVLANTLVDQTECFLPQRFLKEDDNNSLLEDPATIGFFPFGIGRHYCPGRHFAVAELKSALTVLLRNYRFKTVSGRVPEYKSEPADTTRLAEPVEFMRVANTGGDDN